jgi:sugar phosphate isomerase/epimerase
MSLEQFVDFCAELGLDGVEFTSYYFSTTELEFLHQLKRHCLRRGMHILATAVGSNFTLVDPDKRREQVAMTKSWIDHSVTLGAPCIRVFAGPIPADTSEEQAFAWAVECLHEVSAHGEARGVVVALENHGGVTSTAVQVQRLLDAVPSSWLGVNLDFGNFRVDPYAEFAQLAPRTVTTHAKVSSRFGDERHPLDYERIREIMAAAGYACYISIEFEEPEDARIGVPRLAGELKRVFR